MTEKKAGFWAELAIIRAQMLALLDTLPATECPIMATDALYERQETIRAELYEMKGEA